MRPRNMDQMAQHILHSIMSPKWGHLNSIMSPKWGHLIIIGTMWLTIITLYSQIVVAFYRDSKYFVLCFDTLSNVLYFIQKSCEIYLQYSPVPIRA